MDEVKPVVIAQHNQVLQTRQSSPLCAELTSRDYYLDSSTNFRFHEEALKDEVCVLALRDMINHSRRLLKGKVVLDVGCGTGLLSMLVAQAGARLVIGIDTSPMVDYAGTIVRANRLDHVVQLVRGDVETATLPVERVDVIVSDWAGFGLLHQSRLAAVLRARDRWLAPGGLLLPDLATLYIAAAEDADCRDDTVDWWDDVHGFDMSCLRPAALSEPRLEQLPHRQVATTSCRLARLDLRTITADQLHVSAPFSLQVRRNDYLHAFVVFFEVAFSRDRRKRAGYSTAPAAPATRWKQTIFYLGETITAKVGERVEGVFACSQGRPRAEHLTSRSSCDTRQTDFHIDFQFAGELCTVKENRTYKLCQV